LLMKRDETGQALEQTSNVAIGMTAETPASSQPRVPRGWETFPHGSDIGVRGFGATPAEAFANAAMALTAVITDPGRVQPSQAIELACEAPDLEILLLDWLNAVVTAIAVERLIFGRYKARVAHLAPLVCIKG